MSGIECLISEHSVDREIFHRFESSFLVSHVIEHLGAKGSSMRAQKVLHSLVKLPVVFVATGSFQPMFVSFFHFLSVLLRYLLTQGRVF